MENLIKGNQAVSLKALHKMLKLVNDDPRCRFKVKAMIERRIVNDNVLLK